MNTSRALQQCLQGGAQGVLQIIHGLLNQSLGEPKAM